jgi:hypothetical protein
MKRFVLVLLALAVAVGASWQLETVEEISSEYSGYCSLVLVSSGYPRIAYQGNDNNIRYAAWDGAAWQLETVEDLSYPYAGYCSLVLDSSDHPRLAYQGDGSDIRYAAWDGAAWQLETVEELSDPYSGYCSLVLDSSGYPRIAYRGDGRDIRYAAWDGAAWQLETVEELSDPYAGYCSLVLDSSGYPRIAYKGDNHDIRYAAWDGAAWQLETVEELSSDNSGYCSLVLDSSGYPRLAYQGDGRDIRYTAWDGAAWQIETVEELSDPDSGYCSLVLDSSGYPRIAYQGDDCAIRYAAWDGAAWQLETVEEVSSDYSGHCSLVLDSSGYPRIAYQGDSYDIHYAWWNDPPTAFSLLSPADGSTVDDYPLGDWEDSSDPEGEDVSYDLWYSTEDDFSTYEEITGLSDSEYQFSAAELTPDTTYYWKVRAWDGYEESWSTESWSFYVTEDVAVEGLELSAWPEDAGVLLGWTVEGETPAGVRVLRGEENPVAVSGSLTGETRRWLDRDVTPGGSYTYWLEVTEDDGSVRRCGPTEAVVVPEAAPRLALEEPWPNPADNSVSVAFSQPEAQRVSLSVYDLAGRRVTTLSEGELPAGRHAVSWDCAGEASGVYLLRLETEGEALSRRVVVGR